MVGSIITKRWTITNKAEAKRPASPCLKNVQREGLNAGDFDLMKLAPLVLKAKLLRFVIFSTYTTLGTF